MRKLLALSIVVAVMGGGVATNSAQAERSNYEIAQRAVCHFFKGDCYQAMKIVKCETGGTYSPWAGYAKHQSHLGIFQMGTGERRRFGHGNNVWAQAKAAYSYFRVSGWHPWLDYEPPGCAS